MTRALITTVMLTLGLLAAGAAQNRSLSGHWEADVNSEGRTFTFAFEFTQTGSALTGTVEIPSVDLSSPITDGKIADSGFSFTGIGLWTGSWRGAELDLTRELDGGKKQHMIAHRTQTR